MFSRPYIFVSLLSTRKLDVPMCSTVRATGLLSCWAPDARLVVNPTLLFRIPIVPRFRIFKSFCRTRFAWRLWSTRILRVGWWLHEIGDKNWLQILPGIPSSPYAYSANNSAYNASDQRATRTTDESSDFGTAPKASDGICSVRIEKINWIVI